MLEFGKAEKGFDPHTIDCLRASLGELLSLGVHYSTLLQRFLSTRNPLALAGSGLRPQAVLENITIIAGLAIVRATYARSLDKLSAKEELAIRDFIALRTLAAKLAPVVEIWEKHPNPATGGAFEYHAAAADCGGAAEVFILSAAGVCSHPFELYFKDWASRRLNFPK